MFKIKNTETGLFSCGGTNPSWSKIGKVWPKRGHVTSHLSLVREYKNNAVYTNCIIEEYEMVSVGTVCDVSDWSELPSTTRAKEIEAQRRAERTAEYKDRQIKTLQLQLEQLTRGAK
jgi:hypothetical protein